MQRRKNSWIIAVLGAGILFAGMGGMLWSMERGMTDEELLALLDSGEQGFFEPASVQAGADPIDPLEQNNTNEAEPYPIPTLYVYLPGILTSAQTTPAVEITEIVVLPTATPSPTPTPTPEPELPVWIEIPALGLNAPILEVQPQSLFVEGQEYYQWSSPDEYAAGWHSTSALLNERGNLVLNGHNNIYGSIFSRLEELVEGDIIYIRSANYNQMYIIANKMTLAEKGQPLDVRIANSGWLQPSDDQRLTLVTCWPPYSDSHRLIIVAVPYP